MLTYEDVTGYFLKTAADVGLTTHPEHWMNSHTLEREFACTCHTGRCEEAENHSSCTISFTWSTLDTALSLDGPIGICDFFHEPDQSCPHLHTRNIPALVLDLSYSLALSGVPISDPVLLSLIQMLKLRASEHSSRAIETRPGISMALYDNRLQPEAFTLQQRVELPIWHPEGMRGLHEELHFHTGRLAQRRYRAIKDDEEINEIVADNPSPENWLPTILEDVCQDIMKVLETLDSL